MKIFRNGLATGLTLQLAIGPIFFYIVNLTLQKTTFDGLAGAFGVTLGDYAYITLSILGIAKLLENKKIKNFFGLLSSVVLIIFGLVIIRGIIGTHISTTVSPESSNIFTSFASVFLLTLSSPLTIVLFTSVFTAKALEYNLTRKELIQFGLGTGSATFVFMASSVIIFSLIKGGIPILVIQILNIIVGCLLISYGGIRLVKSLSNSTR